MTHTSTEQPALPEALRLAEMLTSGAAMIPEIDLPEAAAELRRLHARVQELEASQARVPLSDDQISALFDVHHADLAAGKIKEVSFLTYARVIEAAHGITQEKQG